MRGVWEFRKVGWFSCFLFIWLTARFAFLDIAMVPFLCEENVVVS
jgi:hypothetical protein